MTTPPHPGQPPDPNERPVQGTPNLAGQPPMPPQELATPTPASRWGELASICFIGWFVGLMLGGFVHNGLGALTPLRVEPGTVERLDIESSSGSRTSNRISRVLIGTTDDGEAWRIVDDNAYRTLEAEGYPQRVEVGIGEWTGNAERVVGESFVVDQQSTGSKIGLGVMIGLMALAGTLATYLLARGRRDGPLRAVGFAVSYFVVGAWCGEQLFGWFQAG